jgi:hypothetical protein
MMKRSRTSGIWIARCPRHRVQRRGLGELVPQSDVGEGPLVTPVPPCDGEDPVPAVASNGVDASVVAGELAVEDPVASVSPSQVAE